MLFQNIEKVTWSEISHRVDLVNPTLGKLINAISPSEQPPLYLASYPFGELILDRGHFKLPYQGNFINLNDIHLPSELQNDLGYSGLPMLMTLDKTSEIFLELNDRTYPLHFMRPGQIFGLWSILDTRPSVYHRGMWSIAAGARTIFLLPKVMDHASHSKMQRQLQLFEAYPPHNLFDQGPVFAEIAHSEKMACTWRNQVLLFSKGWYDGLKSNKWPELYSLLLQREWDDTVFLRNHLSIEIIWQILAQAQAHTRLKPNVYVIDTVKHLINIAMNVLPGFAPLSQNDETIAPIQTIQEAYIEHYGLKQYIPTLMAPGYINDNDSIYYSFLNPSLLSLSPNHNFRNTLEDERNIKGILELFQSELSQYPEYQKVLTEKVNFDFFHFESDNIYDIKATQGLAEIDSRLASSQDPERIFAENAPFLRSCVRLSHASRIR